MNFLWWVTRSSSRRRGLKPAFGKENTFNREEGNGRYLPEEILEIARIRSYIYYFRYCTAREWKGWAIVPYFLNRITRTKQDSNLQVILFILLRVPNKREQCTQSPLYRCNLTRHVPNQTCSNKWRRWYCVYVFFSLLGTDSSHTLCSSKYFPPRNRTLHLFRSFLSSFLHFPWNKIVIEGRLFFIL